MVQGYISSYHVFCLWRAWIDTWHVPILFDKDTWLSQYTLCKPVTSSGPKCCFLILVKPSNFAKIWPFSENYGSEFGKSMESKPKDWRAVLTIVLCKSISMIQEGMFYQPKSKCIVPCWSEIIGLSSRNLLHWNYIHGFSFQLWL